MNKITMTLIVGLITIVSATQMNTVQAMYEDQFELCNFEGECFVFNQDDYLSESQTAEFQLFFNNDMDTYDRDASK